MAIRNSNFGGTDWSNAEILFPADLNDTFDAVPIFSIDRSTQYTTEYTQSYPAGDYWHDTTTLTLTLNANDILLGIYLECDMKTSGSPFTEYVRVIVDSKDPNSVAYLSSSSGTYETKTGFFDFDNISGQTTYAIKVQQKSPSYASVGTIYLDNITVSAYYIQNALITTDSGKFS